MISKANQSRMHTRGPTSMVSKLYSVAGRGKTNIAGGGGEGGGKSSAIQVIFNGKIATPQSLLSRKPPKRDDVPKVHAAWMPTKAGEGAAGIAMTLDESSEFSEKPSQMSKLKRCVNGSEPRLFEFSEFCEYSTVSGLLPLCHAHVPFPSLDLIWDDDILTAKWTAR